MLFAAAVSPLDYGLIGRPQRMLGIKLGHDPRLTQ